MSLKVWQFISALGAWKDDGFATVSRDDYHARLMICQHCPSNSRNFLVCSADRGGCGCLISLKAVGRVWDCPNGHWPKLSDAPSHH
jgi:hypothetical protein